MILANVVGSIDFINGGFYFLRHGESQNNRLNRVNGWTDCPLTERGEEQARESARLLMGEPIRRIVCSDLQRAQRTAEIVAEILDIPVVEVIPGLRERNWGIYEDQPRAQRPSLDALPERGEGFAEYYSRVEEALRKISLDQHTLIVGHAGTMRVLYVLLGVEDTDSRVGNAAPLRIHTHTSLDMEFL